MNTHERFIEAVMNAIPDPSPAIAAYIENYQANLHLLASDDWEDRNKAINSGTPFWTALTNDERRQLESIQKGL